VKTDTYNVNTNPPGSPHEVRRAPRAQLTSALRAHLDARIPESAGEKFFEPVGLEEVHAGPRARDVVDEEGDITADMRDLSAVDILDPLDAFE